MRMRRVKSATVLALLLIVALVFGMEPAADAATVGSIEFVANFHLPQFPCPGGCYVSNLSGKVNGVIAGTSPNGVTACTNNCSLGMGPSGIFYGEFGQCFLGRIPPAGFGKGDVQIAGGGSVLAAKTPLVLHINYSRTGAVVVVALGDEEKGWASVGVGLFRFTSPTVPHCDFSPQDVQIIGVGVVGHL